MICCTRLTRTMGSCSCGIAGGVMTTLKGWLPCGPRRSLRGLKSPSSARQRYRHPCIPTREWLTPLTARTSALGRTWNIRLWVGQPTYADSGRNSGEQCCTSTLEACARATIGSATRRSSLCRSRFSSWCAARWRRHRSPTLSTTWRPLHARGLPMSSSRVASTCWTPRWAMATPASPS